MQEKTVSEAIAHRRSVRVFDSEQPIAKEVVKKCIENATMAPNSSNLQLWEFYHITDPEALKQIATLCFNQPAAKTATTLVIPVVRLDYWPKRAQANVEFIKSSAPDLNDKRIRGALSYYQKTIPMLYRGSHQLIGWLHRLKVRWDGRKKVSYREVGSNDLRVVAHKSTALAAQNFMMSMAAFGYDTCPMEGFDSQQLKTFLDLPKAAEISMVLGCGVRKKEGVYGKRFRVPFEEVYKEK